MAIQKTEKIWHNGKLINWDDATIHVMSHVIHYGSSVFEGIRCYDLPSGPAIFRADEHMQRLLNSAKVYRIDVDFTREQLVKGMLDTVGHNGAWPCYVRPIILRGYGEAGVNPFNSPTEVYIINYPWGKYLGGESEGCDVCVASWTRLAPNTLPAMAKAGANYMNSQLIKMEAIVNGYVEGIALDVNGFVSEALHCRRSLLHRHGRRGHADSLRRQDQCGQRHDGPHHQDAAEGVLRHRARREVRPPQLAHSRPSRKQSQQQAAGRGIIGSRFEP